MIHHQSLNDSNTVHHTRVLKAKKIVAVDAIAVSIPYLWHSSIANITYFIATHFFLIEEILEKLNPAQALPLENMIQAFHHLLLL